MWCHVSCTVALPSRRLKALMIAFSYLPRLQPAWGTSAATDLAVSNDDAFPWRWRVTSAGANQVVDKTRIVA